MESNDSRLKELASIINNSEDETKIWNAVMELGRKKFNDTYSILVKLLENTQSDKIRNAAAIALRDLGDVRALKPLTEVLKNKHISDKSTIAYALEAFNCTPIIDILINIYLAGDPVIRASAYVCVERINFDKVPNKIIKECKRKISYKLRIANGDDKIEVERLSKLIEAKRKGSHLKF